METFSLKNRIFEKRKRKRSSLQLGVEYFTWCRAYLKSPHLYLAFISSVLHIKDDDTALILAARNGHDDIVELLLAREDIEVNMQNKVSS
jgi:hypothetical protein